MEGFLREFKSKAKHKKIKIAVVGLGYVGLPLAIEFAKNGFAVTGIDIDKQRLGQIKKRESYITDVPAKELRAALASGKFSASGDFRALKSIDVIIICVPTPKKKIPPEYFIY